MSDRKTVAEAYALAHEVDQKQSEHERLCAFRYEGINNALVKLEKLIWGVLLSIAGFLAITLVAVVLHTLKLA